MNILKLFAFVLGACGLYLLADNVMSPWINAYQPRLSLDTTIQENSKSAMALRDFKSEMSTSTVSKLSIDVRCDGRIYCSQMTSCAEAQFFIAHCPNTEMDGDTDGIPCEKQWCGQR